MRFEFFFVKMWLAYALERANLPPPVRLKRLAAPRLVFIFGIIFSCRPQPAIKAWGLVMVLFGSQDHDHIPALQFGELFNHRQVGHVLDNAFQHSLGQIGVGDFASPEHEGYLGFVLLR